MQGSGVATFLSAVCYTDAMEHTQPQGLSPQSASRQTAPLAPASQNKLALPIGLLLVIVFAGVSGYLFGQQRSVQTVSQEITAVLPSPTSQAPVAVASSSPELAGADMAADVPNQWRMANHGQLFSYEYPASWHVAELWPDGDIQTQGITIALDPSPINTAPRGGPIATFKINVLSGQQNPEQVFAQKKAQFNSENYTDIQSEVLQSELGPIYYFKGKMIGPMYEGEQVENYFFTFNQKDPLNQQIIVATMELNKDPKMSELLRHVVLSFKFPPKVSAP